MKKIAINNNSLRRITSYASVGVASCLIAVKLWAFLLTDSVALFSSFMDSMVDLVASMITAWGVLLAMRPPDREHRYGHGKAEALAALAQAAFIFLSAGAIVVKACDRALEPTPLQNEAIGQGVMLFAIVLTSLLVALQSYTVKRTGSIAIASDRLHYVGDIFINAAVLATFTLQGVLNILWLDPLFALVIAVLLFVGAFQIGKKALRVLMDAELPPKKREKIIRLIKSVSGVHGVHDVRTRVGSNRIMVEAHIELDPEQSLMEAHKITEAVEAKIHAVFREADVMIHQDPFGIKEERLDQLIDATDPIDGPAKT